MEESLMDKEIHKDVELISFTSELGIKKLLFSSG